MLVRIRWSTPKSSTVLKYQVALAVGSFLTPLALAAFTISFWGFAVEFGWASGFFITAGLFSHWQVWLAVAGMCSLLAWLLSGYGSNEANTAS